MQRYNRLILFFLVIAVLPAGLTAAAFSQTRPQIPADKAYEQAKQDAMGICPPIFLRDENGNVINLATGVNADVPYSPKQTCGKCHDYGKITEGFHFMQGKGEKMTPGYAALYPWCTTPGQYGGRW